MMHVICVRVIGDTKNVSAPKQKNLGTGLKLAEHPAYDLMNYEYLVTQRGYELTN